MAAVVVQNGPNPTRIVLLCKRALIQDEKDLLEHYLNVVYFNPRVHTDRKLVDLVSSCELLVLDLTVDEIRNYYEFGRKPLDGTVPVVLLEKSGVKVDPSRPYGETYVKKRLPMNAEHRGDLLFKLLCSHIPKVKVGCLEAIKKMIC